MAKRGETDKTELFERLPIPQAVRILCIPTVISMLVTIIYNLADTLFVGMLGDPIQTSAITLATPVTLSFVAVTNLFGTGGSSMMSRSLGSRDYDAVRRTAAFSIYCTAFMGLLYSLVCTLFKMPLGHLLGAKEDTIAATLEYMKWTVTCGAIPSMCNLVMGMLIRAEGSALHASIGTMSGAILNIILDPFFILPFGLGMGAAGAGLATFLSNCAACLYFIIYINIKKNSTYVSLRPADFKPDRRITSGVCGVGIPAAIQNLLNVTGMTILNNFTAGYGSDAVAAMGIAHKITMLPTYVSLGISSGVMPLVGYNFASGNRKRMKEAVIYTAKISFAIAAAIAAAYLILARGIMGLFMDNEKIVAIGSALTRGFIIAQPLLTIDFLGVGVFQACGKGRIAFVFAILRKLVLEIPAIILLDKLFPLYGLPYSQFVSEVILASASALMTWKLLGQKAEK